NRRDQIVAVEHREIEKLACDLHAHRVQPDVFGSGSTKTVAKKSGHRIATTAFQFRPENIRRHDQANSGSSVETVASPSLCRSACSTARQGSIAHFTRC